MSSTKIKVMVDDFLEEIMPDFLLGLEKEIIKTQTAFDQKDFSILAQFGHKLRGNAPCYGLNELGEMGNQLEALAVSSEFEPCRILFEKVKYYLAHLEIEFVKDLKTT